MSESIQLRMLRLLDEEGPLSPKGIVDRLGMSRGTVKALINNAKNYGAVQLFKGIRGMYELTDHGRSLLEAT